MQTRNKFFDDVSQMMTNAMGVAQGAKDEAETAFKGMLDRWLADRDFVTAIPSVKFSQTAQYGFRLFARPLDEP